MFASNVLMFSPPPLNPPAPPPPPPPLPKFSSSLVISVSLAPIFRSLPQLFHLLRASSQNETGMGGTMRESARASAHAREVVKPPPNLLVSLSWLSTSTPYKAGTQ